MIFLGTYCGQVRLKGHTRVLHHQSESCCRFLWKGSGTCFTIRLWFWLPLVLLSHITPDVVASRLALFDLTTAMRLDHS